MIRLSGIIRQIRRYEWPAFAAVGVWAAAILLYVLVLGPKQWTVLERGRAWEAARREAAQLQTILKTVDDLGAFRKRLLQKKDFSTIVSTLSQMARADHLSIPGVSYKADKDSQNPYTKLTMTFTVSGRYQDIRRFIADMESSNSFLLIEDMNLNSESKGDGLELKIQVSTYFSSVGS